MGYKACFCNNDNVEIVQILHDYRILEITKYWASDDPPIHRFVTNLVAYKQIEALDNF